MDERVQQPFSVYVVVSHKMQIAIFRQLPSSFEQSLSAGVSKGINFLTVNDYLITKF